MEKLKTIAIYGNRHQSAFIDEITAMLDVIAGNGADLVMCAKLFDYLCRDNGRALPPLRVVPDNDLGCDADLAISIGGDGTFLRTAAWIGRRPIPILGINTGHLGYLSEHDMSDWRFWLPGVLLGVFVTERRSLISVGLDGLPPIPAFNPCALNEVAILKKDTASMIDVEAYVDGTFLADYRADGLIVATPTGSTAYNLSVGGPIVQPTAPVFVISPIAAHSLSMRPLVVSSDSMIDLVVGSRSNSFRLSLDGRSIALPVGSHIRLTRADYMAEVVTPRQHSFADTLRRKLNWGTSNI